MIEAGPNVPFAPPRSEDVSDTFGEFRNMTVEDSHSPTESRARDLPPTESRARDISDSDSRPSDVPRTASRARARIREDEPQTRSRPRSRHDEAPTIGDVPGLINWFTSRTSMYAMRLVRPTPEHLCFLEERLRVPMAYNACAKAGFGSKNASKERRGKTLKYSKESKEIREGLDILRHTELLKWMQFIAGKPCKGKELQKLLDEGHIPIPTQWIEVDRNAFKKRDGGPVVPLDLKSRLVGTYHNHMFSTRLLVPTSTTSPMLKERRLCG